MSKINTTYQELADYIFSFFSSCTAPGQGLFLFRTLNATTRKYGKTQAEINLCHIVIFNLLENGYLEAANEPSPFVRLTEKGFDYLQGDDLIKNQINLKEYIDLSKEDVLDDMSVSSYRYEFDNESEEQIRNILNNKSDIDYKGHFYRGVN